MYIDINNYKIRTISPICMVKRLALLWVSRLIFLFFPTCLKFDFAFVKMVQIKGQIAEKV